MNLNTFMKCVLETKALDTGQNKEALCELLTNNVNLITMREWIENLQTASGDSEIANLASLMEVHPLGFEKYVLWDSISDGSRARLHYWPENKWPFESIHDHRFNFCAIVIKGHYTHEEYKVVEKENNRVDIELVKTSIIRAGEAYYFDAGTFHRVMPSEEETLSFLVRSNSKLPFSRVINPETLEMRKAFGAIHKFKNKLKNIEGILV